MSIEQRIKIVRDKISLACARSNRNPSDITLIAVTKTIPAARVKEAIAFGVKDIGKANKRSPGEVLELGEAIIVSGSI